MTLPEIRHIDIDGFRLAIDALDSLGLGRGAAFEPEILEALQRWVTPGQTVVDIGANIGYFTAHMARRVGPGGEVHAFEPEPANYALLVANMAANGLQQVRVHRVALGDRDGTATLHTSDFNGGMHRLYDSLLCRGPAVEVPLRRLDDLVVPGTVALIKIDIEGWEPVALAGARRCIAARSDLRILAEYCPASMLEAGCSPGAFLGELLSQGLLPFELDGRPCDLAQLQDDARRYDQFGLAGFVAASAGRGSAEIVEIVGRISRSLGCTRPLIENLMFARTG